jgi:hypothetical protein
MYHTGIIMEWSCNCIAKQQKPLENTINQPIQKNIGTKTQETIGNNGNHKETTRKQYQPTESN